MYITCYTYINNQTGFMTPLNLINRSVSILNDNPLRSILKTK